MFLLPILYFIIKNYDFTLENFIEKYKLYILKQNVGTTISPTVVSDQNICEQFIIYSNNNYLH